MTLPGLPQPEKSEITTTGGMNSYSIKGKFTIQTLIRDMGLRFKHSFKKPDDEILTEHKKILGEVLKQYRDIELEFVAKDEDGHSIFYKAVRMGMPCVQTSGHPLQFYVYLENLHPKKVKK